jgi:hypothetical protein
MLSETIVEFVECLHGHRPPVHMRVSLAPEDCFAFLSFVSVFWRWGAPGSSDLN